MSKARELLERVIPCLTESNCNGGYDDLISEIRAELALEYTPWMDWLRRHDGEAEIEGGLANPFITSCFNYTTLKDDALAKSDETAWCAALACAALEINGYTSPRSASAASFDNYGTPLAKLRYGAILTFKRVGGSGRHVTFFEDLAPGGDLIYCRGGNQKNKLQVSLYEAADLRSIRWPIKKT